MFYFVATNITADPGESIGKGRYALNTFLFLFSTTVLVIGAGIHKLLVRIANKENPEQFESALFV